MAQKSIDSCSGKVLVESSDSVKSVSHNASGYLAMFPTVFSSSGADFIIDVKRVGQGFDLDAEENVKYCFPSPYQDLLPDDDLA